MNKSTTLTDTFQIDGDNNPLMVKATLCIEKEDDGYTWNVTHIHWVELQVGTKEGIDITRQVMSNTRAKALITSQVADQEDQIIEALCNSKTAA